MVSVPALQKLAHIRISNAESECAPMQAAIKYWGDKATLNFVVRCLPSWVFSMCEIQHSTCVFSIVLERCLRLYSVSSKH